MKEIINQVEIAKKLFRQKLESTLSNGGLSKDRYVRFLSMQYHLTKGVQKHFMSIAANPLTAKKKSLRKWLINFAQEEEFHFEIAKNDLKALGCEPLAMPFDTELWWAYFDSIIQDRPFIRLGATCVLENIADGSSDILDSMIKCSDYLKPQNLKFLTIHRHGPNLAHGDQILEALEGADLTQAELENVLLGAKRATIFYLRSAYWIINGEDLK